MFDLSSKKVIITGGSGLVGSSLFNAIVSAGGVPIIFDLHEPSDPILANKIFEERKGYFWHCDITSEGSILSCLNAVLEQFGEVDSLINNAAINPRFDGSINKSHLENYLLENWDRELSVGLTGAFLCTKHIGAAISKNKSGGVILNISSDLGLISPNQSLYFDDTKGADEQFKKPVSYSVVKSGLIGLTKYVATYWSDRNVRCNALCPGGIYQGQPERFVRKVQEHIPLGRMARTDEYGATIVWMLSDEAEYLNGAIISMDGGRTAW